MSWEVREKREVYVKEMKWGCINGDEKENVVEELVNGFFIFLVDEFIFDLVLWWWVKFFLGGGREKLRF